MCELMFPKPTKKKKRKHHPAPIVDTVKGECFLCRLEGIRRQQYPEEHHESYITAERPENCYAGSSRGSTKKPTQGKSSECWV